MWYEALSYRMCYEALSYRLWYEALSYRLWYEALSYRLCYEALSYRLWYEALSYRLWYEALSYRLCYEALSYRLWYEAEYHTVCCMTGKVPRTKFPFQIVSLTLHFLLSQQVFLCECHIHLLHYEMLLDLSFTYINFINYLKVIFQ